MRESSIAATEAPSSDCDVAATDARRRLRDIGILGLKVAFTGVFLWAILSRVSLHDVLERARGISAITIGLVVLLLLLHVVISAVRWRLVLKMLGESVAWRTVINGTLLERFVNQVLPSTISGDVGRVVTVNRETTSTRNSIMSVLFDRALALGGIVFAVALGLPLSLSLFPNKTLQAVLLITTFVSALGILLVVLLPPSLWEHLGKRKWLKQPMAVIERGRWLLTKRRFYLAGLGMSLAAQLLLVVAFQLLARDVGVSLSFWEACAAVPAIILFSLIPLSIAGWGAREGAAVVLLGFLGASAADAVAASVLYGLLSLLVACLGAPVWLLMDAMKDDAKKGNVTLRGGKAKAH